MGNACSGPSVTLSSLYLSGLSSPTMASNLPLDPVHPNVAKQKQYQVRVHTFPSLSADLTSPGGGLQGSEHRSEY